MRKTFAALAALTVLFISNQAYSGIETPLTQYATAISASSPAYRISAGSIDETTCANAAPYGCPYTVSGGGACDNFHVGYGLNIQGESCCVDTSNYCAARAAPQLGAEKSVSAENLRDVYSSDRSYYWGFVNASSRSPQAGRSNAATANLDACIGHGETDLLGTGSTGWGNCYSKCDSSVNGFCTSTGTNDGTTQTAAVCKDRCDCTMGFSTCNGL